MSPYRKRRRCRGHGGRKGFKPMGIPAADLQRVLVEPDEFEAVRLCDLEGLSQIETGEEMGVSRGTVQRLLISGRSKIVDALLNSKMLVIDDLFDTRERDEDGEY